MVDFDINEVKNNKIELLDCQIDVIMRSLEMYLYMYKFAYPRKDNYMSKEDELRISMAKDTYETISMQYTYKSRRKNPFVDNVIKDLEKRIV